MGNRQNLFTYTQDNLAHAMCWVEKAVKERSKKKRYSLKSEHELQIKVSSLSQELGQLKSSLDVSKQTTCILYSSHYFRLQWNNIY